MSFTFIDNVPIEVRQRLHPRLKDWIDRKDFPVYGLYISGVGKVDFCRRPWPAKPGDQTTVGAEREVDELLLRKWIGQC